METTVVRDARVMLPMATAAMAAKAISPKAAVARVRDRLLKVVVEEVTHRDARAWAQAMVSVMEPAPATAPVFSLLPHQQKVEEGSG